VTTRLFARLGPACGLLSSVSLFVLPQHHLKPLHLAAFVLFLPFLAYLCNLLRGTSEEAGWLAQTAFATGVAGITLKLASITPEIAINRYQIAAGTTLHSGLQGIADAATEVALFPLGFMLVALAVVAVRSRAPTARTRIQRLSDRNRAGRERLVQPVLALRLRPRTVALRALDAGHECGSPSTCLGRARGHRASQPGSSRLAIDCGEKLRAGRRQEDSAALDAHQAVSDRVFPHGQTRARALPSLHRLRTCDPARRSRRAAEA
jgi:hypothetical protein